MLLAIFFSAFFASAVCCIFLIRTQHLHARLTMDTDLAGVQKFHATPTPRIGGVPVLVGMLVAGGVALWAEKALSGLFWLIILAAMPVFLAGLLEDLTKKVRPLWRLLAAFVSAAAAAYLSGSILPKIGMNGVDALLASMPLLGILFTVFAVGGVCHSVNIIDGYNGLMAGVAFFALVAFSYVALAVGDIPLLALCLAGGGAILGFLLWNFPRGMIFAGDAGAYFIGFLLAQLAVLLVARHPDKISPWFPLLVLIYPVFETIFSIYRKKIVRKISPGVPDGLHFHMLVYKRLVRWMVGSRETKHLLRRNSLTAPYLWGVALFSIMPAMAFWKAEWMLKLCAVLFVVGYVWTYRRLVTFRSPRRLILQKENSTK